MSNAWENASKEADEALKGGLIVKLENDKDKVVGVFCGEPFMWKQHWDQMKNASFTCTGDGCIYCNKGFNPSTKFALNFYVLSEKRMKVIQGGAKWFKTVTKVKEKYGLGNKVFEIERMGVKGDPQTKYTMLPESDIDAKLQAEIASVKLINLEEACASKKGQQSNDNTPSPIISIADQALLISQLKAVDRDTQVLFMNKFGKVNVLTMNKFDDACQFLALNEPMPF